VAEVPRHPEVDEAGIQRVAPEAAKAKWAGYAIAAVIAMVVILVIVLHLTGVIQPPTH